MNQGFSKTAFYQIPVKNIERQTRNAITIELEVPDELKGVFAFDPGQYLTFRKTIDGEEVRRNYSLCSSPLDKKWQVGIKKVPDGIFTGWAHGQLKPGDLMEVMPPMGKFTPALNPAHSRHYCAFAAGSGITPILSIISATLATEPNSCFTLVYGNQSRSSIMFKEELEALKDKYMHRISLYHILSREKTDAEINHGRIDPAKCEQIFSKLLDITTVDEFYLCGPEGMSAGIKAELLTRGVEEKKIRMELFTTAKRNLRHKPMAAQANDEAPKSRVTIRHDGIESSFDLAYDSDPIMDAALHEGLELPYSCKGGMCCTCKAKLVKGEVDMEVHYGLEHDEIEKGFILTCQSHPKTSEVVVDFDIR